MARLPQVSRRLTVTDQVQSSVSADDVARPYRMVAEALGTAGAVLQQKAESDAAAAGQNAVNRDQDGTLRVEPRSNWTEAGRTYNRAAHQAYVARLSTDIRGRGNALQAEARGDPVVFNKAWAEFRRTAVRNAPPETRGAVDVLLDQEGQRLFDGVVSAKRTSDLQAYEGSMKAELALLDDELAALAGGGGTATPDYREKRTQFVDLYSELAENPDFAVSPKEVEIAIKRAESRHLAEASVGAVHRVFETEGMAAAERAAARLLDDASLALTPAERRQYRSAALADLRDVEAGRKAELRELRPLATEIERRLNDGLGLDEADVDETIAELNRLGDPSRGMRLMRARARARFLGDYVDLDDAGQLALVEQGFGGGGFRSALAARESSGNPAALNTFGYAGLYQFGAPRLAAIGIYSPGDGEDLEGWSRAGGVAAGKWSGTFSIAGFPEIKTLQQFLASPAAQEKAFDLHQAKMDEEISANGLDKHVGETIGGAAITREGLYAMLHLGGVEGAKRALGGSDTTDAYGTSVLDYARLGGGPAAIDRETLVEMRREVTEDAKSAWTGIKEGFTRGLPPTADDLDLFARQLAIVDDGDFREEVADALSGYENGYLLSNVAPAQAEALVASIRAGMGEDGYTELERETISALETSRENAAKAISADPYGHAVSRGLVPAPEPVDFANPQGAAQTLAKRQGAVRMVEARYGVAGVPALLPRESETLAAQWSRATVEERTAMVATLAGSLDERTLKATLAPFAAKSDTRALAFAGALHAVNPDASAGIVRGQALIEQNPKLVPTDNATFREDVDSADGSFPIRAFAPMMEPARDSMMQAVLARYADLSNRAGDTTGAYVADRFERAAAEVTGGLVEFNGAKVIAPSYGMPQADFDARIRSLTDADFAGAVTSEGRPVGVETFRGSWINGSQFQLRSFGDGRYLVQVGPDEEPAFLMRDTGASGTRRGSFELAPFGLFTLDLRARGES